MKRTARLIELQNQIGYLVESSTKETKDDIIKLKAHGLYPYGVRHRENDWGKPVTIENNLVTVDHYGYAVFQKPIKFPKRENNLFGEYYTLNNRWSTIHDAETVVSFEKIWKRGMLKC